MRHKININLVIFIVLITTICYTIYNFSTYKAKKISSTPQVKNTSQNINQDNAIKTYLLNQLDFSWKTATNSTNLCLFDYLETNQVFPLSIWVRCGEFVESNQRITELSGVSLPALITYTGSKDLLDLKKMSHQIPESGDKFEKSLSLFPETIVKKIKSYDQTFLDTEILDLAAQKLNPNLLQKRVTISGTAICLTHLNTTIPNTEECGYGVKTENGEEYALSDAETKYVSNYPIGKKITVTGLYYPRPNNFYLSQKIIDLESLK